VCSLPTFRGKEKGGTDALPEREVVPAKGGKREREVKTEGRSQSQE